MAKSKLNYKPEIRKAVYERDNGICQICHKPVEFEKFALDHIFPLSRGGPDVIENLQTSHLGCNIRKGNSTPTESRSLPYTKAEIDRPFKIQKETLNRIMELAKTTHRTRAQVIDWLVADEWDRMQGFAPSVATIEKAISEGLRRLIIADKLN